MPTLYELAGDRKALYDLLHDMIDPETGEAREFTDEEAAAFVSMDEETSESLDRKIDNICKVFKVLNAEAEVAEAERCAMRDEMARLSRTAKARDNAAGRAKMLISKAFDLLGKTKHKTALFNVYTSHSAKSAKPGQLFDIDKIPVRFQKRELDAKAVSDAVKAGELFEREDRPGSLFYTAQVCDGDTCALTERELEGVTWGGTSFLVVR